MHYVNPIQGIEVAVTTESIRDGLVAPTENAEMCRAS